MRISESLRRPDWLDELHGLLLTAVVLSGLAGVAGGVSLLAGRPLEVEVAAEAALRPDALAGAPAGVTVGSGLSLQVADPSSAQLVWALFTTAPSYALVMTLLVLLWRSAGRARRGDPFVGGLAGRLRGLGLLLVIGGPVAWVVESVARFGLSATVADGGTYGVLSFTTPAVWLLGGFGLLAIGEIVRRGEAMRAELDGVV